MREGWEVKKLGHVCDFVRGPFGGSLKKSCFKHEGYAVYEQQHAIYDQFEDIRYFVDQTKFNEMQRFEVASGDLIMSCSGTMGKVAIVPEGITRGIINQALLKLSPGENLFVQYLKYWMESISFQEQISMHSQGAAIKNVASVKILKEIDIPLPLLPEQKRIVAILDEAFAGIATATANAEKNLKNARELFESALNSVFTEKGEGWVEKTLGDLTEKITKGSSPKWQGVNYVEEPGVLFITSENINTNKMNYRKTKYVEEIFNEKDRKSILKKGDVLTNIVGASIGRTAVFDRDDVSNINQAVCLIRCTKEKLINKYLVYLLNSPFFKQILHDNEINNARANLSLGFFRSLEIPVPSHAEQQRIVTKLDNLATETKCLEAIYQQKLDSLTELKQSILQKAFAGELTTETPKIMEEAVA